MHGDFIDNDRMCACGFGGAAEHDARSRLRGRIARYHSGALATQALLAREPWQIGTLFFVLMALAMLPAAFWAGGADKIPGPSTATTSMREVLGQAMRNRPFLVMSGAYFVCGLNLVFLSTHLPAYLALCGQDIKVRSCAGLMPGIRAFFDADKAWMAGTIGRLMPVFDGLCPAMTLRFWRTSAMRSRMSFSRTLSLKTERLVAATSA